MNKKINMILILVSVISLFIGTFSISLADSSNGFTDLTKDNWAYEAINNISKLGIISGYPDGSFKPNKYVTYGEFIKMVAVIGNVAERKLKAKDGEHWAKAYYDAGLNNFYFTEWDIKTNVLDFPIPRKHMAMVVSGAVGRKVDIGRVDYGEIQSKISDVDHNTPYEHEIIKSYAAGVLSGYPDGSFRPEGTLTRAEVSIVIVKLQSVLGNNNETMKSYEVGMDEEDDINDLVAVEEDPIGFTKGTVDFRMFNYAKNKEERHVKLLELLRNYFLDEGEEMHKVLIKFASKPIRVDQQAIRKQYFGAYPVLMEKYGDIVGMYVFPIGYDGKYWDTRPGQVREECF